MFNENIPNIRQYLNGMDKTILDKALFMSHVDADIIVDFGCAGGALIKFLHMLFPDKYFIGYDISYQMLQAAVNSVGESDKTFFTSNWDTVMLKIKHIKEANSNNCKTCLVCSSVIHEVYAYSSRAGIEKFWERFWGSGFDYIAVRDMYGTSLEHVTPSYERSFKEAVSKTIYRDKLNEFTRIYGSLTDVDVINHFLLKYFYTDNWDRELNENYMPYDGYIHDMTRCVGKYCGYNKIFDIKYLLPYIKKRVYNDFGIVLEKPTHYQIIFEKL